MSDTTKSVAVPFASNAIRLSPREWLVTGAILAILGWLIPAGDVEKLAQTMAEVLSDRARAARVGRSAAACVQQHFSIERMADAYEALYRTGLQPAAPLREIGTR